MALKIAAEKGANTMRAWVLKEGGDVAKIALEHVEIPSVVPAGQILVDMHASSSNPVDWKRAGFGAFGAAFPGIHGTDGAGVIEALGDGVEGWKVGDRIHFWNNVFAPFGTFAEKSLVPANAVVAIPDGMSFEVAAALPCAAWTAHEALFGRMRVEKDKWIYIASGAGGVGHIAIQMAKKIGGCKVITTASGDNVERLRKSGWADLVIDYRNADVKAEIMKATNNEGCEYVFDMLTDSQAATAMECVAFGGQYTTISQNAPAREPGHFFLGITTHHVFIPGHHGCPRTMKAFVAIGAEVAKLVQSGVLELDISKTVPFDETGKQLVEQQAGHVRGKAVIKIQ